MKYLKLLCLFLVINTTYIYSQKNDTLNIAKELNSHKQYNKSVKLLDKYYSNHKNDLFTAWLYAQALHKAEDKSKSQEIYELTIKQFPDNNDLKLDFINILIESGELSKAIIHINNYIHEFPDAYKFEAEKTLAQIYYWKSDYDQSLIEINKALVINNDDQSANNIKNEISMARSNWLKISSGYFTDDQPLKEIKANISAGFYVNSMTTLGINADYSYSDFSKDTYSTPWIKGLANFNLHKYKTGIKLEAGALRYSSGEKNITGLIEVNKKISKYINIVLGASYQPYLATTFTIKDKLMQTHYGAAIEWNNPTGIIGRVSIDKNIFPSINNSYYSASGWIVSPPLRLKKVEFRIGYGINYSDSENSNFIAIENLDSMITNWDSTFVVEGNYNPLFTPNNQIIHSAVGLVKYNPNKRLSIGIDVSYGFNAESDSPYLYLGGDNEGTIIVVREFSNQNYNPMDINGFVNFEVSKNISLKGFYKYKKTYYYESYYTGLIANITF